MKFRISIIIPSHNRSSNIPELIEYFTRISEAEIIVVENGSNSLEKNKYMELIEKYKDHKNLHISLNEKMTAQEARSIGTKKSIGEYIFYCDDDDKITNKFINWLNDNTLSKDIYSFDIIKRGIINRKFSSPKSFEVKEILKTLQMSVWLIKAEIAKKIFGNRKFPLEITMGEDQLFSAYIFIYANENKIKLEKINICSIWFMHFRNDISVQRSDRNFKNDLLLNEWLSTKTENIYFKKLLGKMTKHRIKAIKNGEYKTEKNLNRNMEDKVLRFLN